MDIMAHLTIDERFRIYEMHKSGYSSRYIGAKIDRDKSTVCYELRKMSGNYRPDKAHDLTILARTNKKKRKLDLDNSPYARIEIACKILSSLIAAILALRINLYFKAKWLVAVTNCKASSLQNATMEAKI